MKKKNIFKFKRNKILLSMIGATTLTAVPMLVSSCSSVSQDLIDKSYLVSKDGKFTSDISTSTIIRESLKTNSGMKSYIEAIANEIVYNWLIKTSNDDIKIKNNLNAEVKKIDKEYNKLVDDYKKKKGANWELLFQQEVLDPNGGNEESYKKRKIYEFAKSHFISLLFANLFLTVYDNTSKKVILNPTNQQILDGLYGISGVNKTNTQAITNNLTYKFDSSAILTSNSIYDPQFAELQQFIFDKYVEYTNPYIINMSLWKYGTPKIGIENIYNIDSQVNEDGNGSTDGSTEGSGGESTDTTTPTRLARTGDSSSGGESGGEGEGGGTTETKPTTGTYIYPYFGDENATNTSNGTISKFKSFVENAKNNYMSNKDLGLKDIPIVYTEDSSTYILAKNSSIFNELYTQFAAASTYLWGKLGSNGVSKLINIDNSIKHDINLSSTNGKTTGLDVISSNFISNNPIFNNGTTQPSTPSPPLAPYNTLNATSVNTTELSVDLVKKIINVNGPLKGLVNSMATRGTTTKIYVADNFIPGTITTSNGSTTLANGVTNNSLSEFMFLRNEAGVHAISIDGSTLINKATNDSDKKKYAGYVVMYRYLMGSKGIGQNFTIDLTSELNNFFSNNFAWLVLEYATSSTTSSKMFDSSFLDEANKGLATSISEYIKNLSFYDGALNATNKMLDSKKQYSANYGYDTYKNGFASCWNYKIANGSTLTSQSIVNPNLLYENTLVTSTANNPFNKNPNNQKSLYDDVLSKIDALISNGFEIQTSSFEGKKYAQYFYTNNYYVNSCLFTVLDKTDFVKSIIENKLLSTYVSDFYDISNNEFKQTNHKDSLKSGLFNFYFLNYFTQETNKFVSYVPTNGTTTPIDNIDLVRTYSKSIWDNQNQIDYETKMKNYNSLLKTITSIKYLYGNGDFSQLLSRMQDNFSPSNKTYILWYSSYNSNMSSLQKPSNTPNPPASTRTTPTSQSIVEISGSDAKLNVNNGYYSSYVGNFDSMKKSDTNGIQYNLDASDKGLYQSEVDPAYYLATSSSQQNGQSSTKKYKIGFRGLVNGASSMPTEVSDALFNKTKTSNVGLSGSLYKYKNKDNLISVIQSITTISSLKSFISELDKTLDNQFNLSSYLNDEKMTISQMKEVIVGKINNNFQNTYFQSFYGYVGAKNSSTNAQNGTINAYQAVGSGVNLYGIYAIQIGYDDLNDYASIKNILKTDADEILIQLLVQQSMNETIKSDAIIGLLKENKITSYDIRVVKALGTDAALWLENWKS